MKQVFYKKVGRRYVPVSEYDYELIESMPKGHHLISVHPGGRWCHYNVDPNYAAMIAAGRVAEDSICQAIHAASESKPQRSPITPRQHAAWEELKRAFGDDLFHITRGSARDLAEAGLKAMQEEADKLMTNPGVKKAYEHFMLMCKLAQTTSSK